MKTLFLAISLAVATAASAAEGSLEGVLNAFLATYAKTNVAWKKEIVLADKPEDVPAGMQLGLSKIVGYYFFAPKTWADLNDAERQAVMSDGRLTAFIISLRNATQPAPGADGAIPTGPKGNAMFPTDGVSLDAVSSGSTAVLPKKRIIDVELSAEQLIGVKSIKVQTLK